MNICLRCKKDFIPTGNYQKFCSTICKCKHTFGEQWIENDQNDMTLILCPICKKRFKQLTFRHLKMHGITYDELKIKYGLDTVTSNRTIELSINKRIGQTFSEQSKLNMSIGQTGKKYKNPPSEEILEKRRLARAGKTYEQIFINRTQEEIAIIKTKITRKGSRLTAEQKAKLKIIRNYPEFKEKIRQKRMLQIIPFKDTLPERMLQDELSLREYAYYKHYPIIGQPDIAFPDKKIAIFADGDYVHMNPEQYSATDKTFKGKTAQEKWDRDKYVTEELQKQGWLVLRYWEHEIKANVEGVVDEIEDVIISKMRC